MHTYLIKRSDDVGLNKVLEELFLRVWNIVFYAAIKSA